MRRVTLQGAVVILTLILTCRIAGTFGSEAPGPAPTTSEDVERPLIWNANTILGLASAALACALSMSAGVGGGGILVPIFNLILGFGIKQSTGLSQSVISASGIGSAVYAFTHGRPDSPKEPLVDMHLALLLTPALLLGVSLGLIANQVSPGWLISTAIILVLSYMSVRTLNSALRLRQTENQPITDILMCEPDFSGEVAFIPSHVFEQLEPPTEQHHHHIQHQQQSIKIPWLKLGQLVLLWVIFGGLQIGKSRLGHCSWGYGALYLAQVFTTLACTVWVLKKDTASSTEEGFQQGEGGGDNEEPLLQDTRGDNGLLEAAERKIIGAAERNMGLVALLAAGAGIIAGLIGLGGGFLLAPLMIELGVPPQVAAATSALMVLFASSSATLSLIAEARLNLAYASTFGAVCCASGFIGGFVLSKVVRRHGSSIVVFLLAGIIALGAGATIVFNGRTVIEQFIDGHLAGFHSFCQHSGTELANPLSVLGIM